MKNNFLPITVDAIFIFAATFAAAFTVMRFYTKLPILSVVTAVLFAVLLTALFLSFSSKRKMRYALKRKDAEHLKNVMGALCIMTDTQLNAFFKTLLSRANVNFAEDNGVIVLEEYNAELRYYFTFSEPYGEKIVEFYKQAAKGRGVLVAGREFGERERQLSERFAGRISLADGAALYAAMKRFETYPEIPDCIRESPRKNKLRLGEAFSKKRAKQYFLYGVSLEFFSFLVFYPVYYIVFGTALIFLSIFCFFFGMKDAPTDCGLFKPER